ncbi:hypothetical protein LTR48_006145 [Friedmanniomyces endolithicus]|uniref:Heterokaryon incompatibility domain-containing protein n=1 Tax=Rachicladosporium monterosium TaxID=1507873 RepID=A0ABR0KZM0_9PEZI|nr:hypothetical protein LTR29_005458 [Friedmanniomyces endolithicus]KAK1083607.1 hypothetical protein LTR48_006145 [Friedmanniomyces endolithicus]KAK5141182.1 hypothetical protein LTR32_006200 [Rachicladosporium monterosium]
MMSAQMVLRTGNRSTPSTKPRALSGTGNESNSQSELVDVSALYRGLVLSEEDDLGVRILELLPGTREDSIVCRLLTERLSVTTRFEALSYTWGAAEPSHTITVNSMPFIVRENLEQALRHLRKKTRRRRLWVDAVCINQLDVEERATQVMQMGQIYRNADQVLIWLGVGDSIPIWRSDMSAGISVRTRAFSKELLGVAVRFTGQLPGLRYPMHYRDYHAQNVACFAGVRAAYSPETRSAWVSPIYRAVLGCNESG